MGRDWVTGLWIVGVGIVERGVMEGGGMGKDGVGRAGKSSWETAGAATGAGIVGLEVTCDGFGF